MQPVISLDDTPYERLLVIADIHGGHKALIALLAELQPGRGDLLVTLGDAIDRGPDSNKVLAKLRNCAAELNTVHLRGNHEGMLLMAMSRSPAMPGMYDETVPDTTDSLAGNISMWLRNGGLSTLESYCHDAELAAQKNLAELKKALAGTYWLGMRTCSSKDALIRHCNELVPVIPAEDFTFLRSTCVDALSTSRHILVHGGYDAQCALKAQQLATLHWDTPSYGCSSLPKTLVVGHQIMRTRLPRRIGSVLYLDTGSASVPDGRLTCMDVLSGQFWQADQNGRICHTGELAPQA